MDERPQQPPEGKLIADALEASGLSIREASRRAGLSYGRWRQVTSGVQNVSPGSYAAVRAPAETLARMARAVGVDADRLETEGQRPDAAAILRTPPPERPAIPSAGPESPRSLDELVDTVVRMLIRLVPPGADRGALEALWQLPPPVYTVERKLVLLAALGDAASSAASPAAEDAGEEGGALRRLPGRAG